MITDFQQQQIDKYLTHNMSTDEMISFEELLKSDVELSNELKYQSEIKEAIVNIALKEKFKLWESEKSKNKLSISINYKKLFAIAASVLLIISVSIFIKNNSHEQNQTFTKTKKNSQIKPIDTEKNIIAKNNNNTEFSLVEINKSIQKKSYTIEVKKESMGFGESPKEVINIEVIYLDEKLKKIKNIQLQNNSTTLTNEITKTENQLNTYEFNENELILYPKFQIKSLEINKTIEGYILILNNAKYLIYKSRKGNLINSN